MEMNLPRNMSSFLASLRLQESSSLKSFGKKFPNQLFQILLADIDSVANSISLIVEKVND